MKGIIVLILMIVGFGFVCNSFDFKPEVLSNQLLVEEDDLNLLIYEGVNEQRTQHNRDELVLIDSMNVYAKKHSDVMMSEGVMFHSITKGVYGENVARIPQHYAVIGCGVVITNNQISKCAVNSWMKSHGHKLNIINKGYTQTGIHASCDGTDCYITQIFK